MDKSNPIFKEGYIEGYKVGQTEGIIQFLTEYKICLEEIINNIDKLINEYKLK